VKAKNKLTRPQPLSSADKKALSRILKKARAFKAFYRDSAPPLIKVPAKRKKQ